MNGSCILAATLALAGIAPVTQGQATAMAEGRRGDLATFRREFFVVDHSYSAGARAEATRRLRRLEQDITTVTSAHFELELARIVALADNGHTGSPASLRSRRYARVPLRLVPLGDQFHVLRADTAHADLLGARLVAIDGRAIREVRATAHTLWGGTPAWRDRHVPFFLESPDQMLEAGVTSRPDAATYRFQLPDGRTVDRHVVADPPDARRKAFATSRWLIPEPLDTDRGTWRFAVPRERAPWAFQEASQFYRMRAAPELEALVVQLRANHDVPGQAIAGFLARATDEIRRARPTHLVLDLRTNGGGDLNNTRDFVQRLPSLVPGRIFVLTSPWTFSAAISTVGYLEQAGRDRVTIVGEPVGDRLEFWAEGRLARLSYSGAAMSFATERHDYRDACRRYTDCHGSIVRHSISVRSLAPDLEAPLSIEALLAGRDPAMDAIAAALARR